MDTEQFFRTVLPASGEKVLAVLVQYEGRTAWKYSAFTDPVAMARAAQQHDAQGLTVYHACNSFGGWYYDEKKQKRRIRTQDNVSSCRSLYDDIDVGKEGCYPTRKEAIAAVKDFVARTQLPSPYVIASGKGFHLYWPMEQDIEVAVWNRLAQKKRLVSTHAGLLIDTAADTDSARVLRPVGTTWRKDGERTVSCVAAGQLTTPDLFEQRLDAYIEQHALGSAVIKAELPSWMQSSEGNIAEQMVTYPPSSLATVAEHCQQIKLFRATGGESEPLWHAVAGIAKHCTDGEALFHDWSSNYAGYSASEAQEKLDNWGVGPTLCDKFRSLNADGCANCPHKCKTPVQLGLTAEVNEPPRIPVEAPVAKEDAPEDKDEDFAYPAHWPKDFGYDETKAVIFTHKKDDTGVVVRVDVATPLFHVINSIKQEDGTSALLIETVIRGKKNRFELPTKFAADAKTLKVQLAAYRIVTMNQAALYDYIQKYRVSLMQRQDEMNTYLQLGWQNDHSAFLIGTKLITKDTAHSVRVSARVPEELHSLGSSRGDMQSWIDGVDELYNRENAEPYQLAICLAFGGILGPFMPSAQWRGIPYALTSDTSGIGKSTVCKIALNIYGNAITSMVTDSTAKGMISRTSTMGTLPFLMDEVTKYVVEPKDMSDLLYALSNGKSRIGLERNGVERASLPGWNVPVMITGNRNILQHVTEHNLSPEATQMRVFEVDMDSYPHLGTVERGTEEYNLHGAEHQAISNQIITNHYGTVGEDWIKWVITHKPEVRAKLASVSEKLRRVMRGGDASKERFYYDLATLMLVGGYFAKKRGYIQFDLNNLRDWIVRHVSKTRVVTEENRRSPEDMFTALMADMNGQLLITTKFETADLRAPTTAEYDLGHVRGSVEGRVVKGDKQNHARVYISIRAVAAWCSKNGVQYTKFKRDLIAMHLIRLGSPGCNPKTGCVRVNIGKGVANFEHIGRMNCLEFDAEAAMKHVAPPATVTELKDAVAR